MAGKTDVVKGRIRAAAGALTGNDQLRGEGKTDQAVTIELPKAFSVRDERELDLVQHLMTRLNPQLVVANVALGVHVNGGPTVTWGLVYQEGQSLIDNDVRGALEQAGLDFKHNAEIKNHTSGVCPQ